MSPLDRALVALITVAAAVALVAFGLALEWRFGDVGGWLSGIGAIAAAGVALRIAARDRAVRRQERAAEHSAQAKVVLVEVRATRDARDETVYEVSVHNHSAMAILDVTVCGAAIGTYDATASCPLEKIDIVPPGAETFRKGVKFIASDGKSVPPLRRFPVEALGHELVGPPPSAASQFIVCWIRFSDAHGNWWTKSSDNELERLSQSPPAEYERPPP